MDGMIPRFYCIFCDLDLILKVKSQFTGVKFPLKMSYFFYQWMNILRLAWIYHCDRFMICLIFGDLDLIFKVIDLQVEYLLNKWMEFLLTCTDISL